MWERGDDRGGDRGRRPHGRDVVRTQAKLNMALDDVVGLDRRAPVYNREDPLPPPPRARASFGDRSSAMRPSSPRPTRRGPLPNAGCRVFVGNIDSSVTWQMLRDVLERVGRVKEMELKKAPGGGTFKGCAIVEYYSEQQATNAMDQLSGIDLAGSRIFVREDREAEKGNYYPPRGAAERPASMSPTRFRQWDASPMPRDRPMERIPYSRHGGVLESADQLFVGNLSYSVTWQDLKDFFKDSGFDVLHTKILLDEEGVSRGKGVAKFRTEREAAAALARLDGRMFHGAPVSISMHKLPSPPRGPSRGRAGRSPSPLHDRDGHRYWPRERGLSPGAPPGPAPLSVHYQRDARPNRGPDHDRFEPPSSGLRGRDRSWVPQRSSPPYPLMRERPRDDRGAYDGMYRPSRVERVHRVDRHDRPPMMDHKALPPRLNRVERPDRLPLMGHKGPAPRLERPPRHEVGERYGRDRDLPPRDGLGRPGRYGGGGPIRDRNHGRL